MTDKQVNLGGRPTKYNDEMQALAEEYAENYKDYGDVVPTLVGMALHLDVATNTIYNWAVEGKPKFLRVFTRVEQLQHKGLVNGGLIGDFNPAIAKMMLTKHGYSDKIEQNHTSSDNSMSPRDSGQAVLEALARKHANS